MADSNSPLISRNLLYTLYTDRTAQTTDFDTPGVNCSTTGKLKILNECKEQVKRYVEF